MKIKLGLLFLTRSDVHHPAIWDSFSRQAGEFVQIFCHTKEYRLPCGAFLLNAKPVGPILTEWGHISLVRAMLLLLSKAMETSELTHFVFLSESCVPIKPWSYIIKKIEQDPRSRIFTRDVKDMEFMHAHRFSRMTQIPFELWRVHSQWSFLDRAAASSVLSHDLTTLFENMFAPDEHYIGTCLEFNGFTQELLLREDVTWLEWTDRSPKNFGIVDATTISKLQTTHCWFARKFQPTSDICAYGLHNSSPQFGNQEPFEKIQKRRYRRA